MKRLLLLLLLYLLTTGLAAQCSTLYEGLPGKTSSTGLADLDAQLALYMQWANTCFGLHADWWIYEDAKNVNAYAQNSSSGTIWLEKSLLLQEYKDAGGDAIAGIIGHEMAHVAQNKRSCGLTGKDRELHADFLAGYFLGQTAYFPKVRMDGFAVSLMSKGDTLYFSPFHHGTPRQRFEAMMTGYMEAATTWDNAYTTGESLLSKPPKTGTSLQEQICFYCNGKGKRIKVCGQCEGSGKQDERPCPFCQQGKFEKVCLHCKGRGKMH